MAQAVMSHGGFRGRYSADSVVVRSCCSPTRTKRRCRRRQLADDVFSIDGLLARFRLSRIFGATLLTTVESRELAGKNGR